MIYTIHHQLVTATTTTLYNNYTVATDYKQALSKRLQRIEAYVYIVSLLILLGRGEAVGASPSKPSLCE
jgi:hypothetical protein